SASTCSAGTSVPADAASARSPGSAGSEAPAVGPPPSTGSSRRPRSVARTRPPSSVPAQQERAGRHHVAARHERELRPGHLVERRAADLARRLDDQVDAVHVRLGKAPPARVRRETCADLETVVRDEVPRLTGLAEAVLLERGEDERREGVVELRD